MTRRQRDILLNCNLKGESAKILGIGVFSPSIDKQGKLKVNFRPDTRLIQRMNDEGAFLGDIRNKDMVGKEDQDYIDRWNKEHPDDPIK